MSKLWVRIDYIVAKTVINGLKDWLKKLEQLLDRAAIDGDKNNSHDNT